MARARFAKKIMNPIFSFLTALMILLAVVYFVGRKVIP